MKREKIYNYFYIVNNLLNGHFYLGVHSTDTLADGYKGSGKALKLAIKKHGKENFELVPLKFFKTRKELMDFEREIVNERFLTYYKGICYNLKRGGEGGCEKRFSDEEMRERELECRRKSRAKYYRKNKEKLNQHCRDYYQQNKDLCKELARKWREDNPEKIKEMGRKASLKWIHKNKEAKAEYDRQHYQQNKERLNAQHRQYKLKKKAAKLASQANPGR